MSQELPVIQEPRADRCETCRFFNPTAGGDVGECRRHAPRPLVGSSEDGESGHCDAWFPTLFSEEWCGEWQAKTLPPVADWDRFVRECFPRVSGALVTLGVKSFDALLTRSPDEFSRFLGFGPSAFINLVLTLRKYGMREPEAWKGCLSAHGWGKVEKEWASWRNRQSAQE